VSVGDHRLIETSGAAGCARDSPRCLAAVEGIATQDEGSCLDEYGAPAMSEDAAAAAAAAAVVATMADAVVEAPVIEASQGLDCMREMLGVTARIL